MVHRKLRQVATLETQIEMRDGTVEHFPGHVDAGEDHGRLGDAWQPLCELLGGEVVELEVAVVLLGSAAAPLADLDGHGARDDVARGQVLKWSHLVKVGNAQVKSHQS